MAIRPSMRGLLQQGLLVSRRSVRIDRRDLRPAWSGAQGQRGADRSTPPMKRIRPMAHHG